MTSPTTIITIPNISITLDQLLLTIRQLDEPTRRQVAQVLLETQMDGQLNHLLQQLAQKPPADDLSEADIAAEVQAVRQAKP